MGERRRRRWWWWREVSAGDCFTWQEAQKSENGCNGQYFVLVGGVKILVNEIRVGVPKITIVGGGCVFRPDMMGTLSSFIYGGEA